MAEEPTTVEEATSQKMLGTPIMRAFREMNYTGLMGESRVKGIVEAEKAKRASWNRGRPGVHDDKEPNEDLLGVAESGAEAFKALKEASDAEKKEAEESQAAQEEAHEAAVKAEAEARASATTTVPGAPAA